MILLYVEKGITNTEESNFSYYDNNFDNVENCRNKNLFLHKQTQLR